MSALPAIQLTTKPITDLSSRVVSLAREVDRLPPGVYTISLIKPDVRAMGWIVEIVRIETIREMIIDKSVNL
jgi:hypothetical protein